MVRCRAGRLCAVHGKELIGGCHIGLNIESWREIGVGGRASILADAHEAGKLVE
jgi:hypothetical protein